MDLLVSFYNEEDESTRQEILEHAIKFELCAYSFKPNSSALVFKDDKKKLFNFKQHLLSLKLPCKIEYVDSTQ